ncbi:helix-turn-helix transcriptional regulator [Variovorax sp. PBL-H6]|uniref:helix-turn-helix transcriptional regulator n=1 Tax=Variovorax sp. PBL-H6 TaxID=434009 RepID=UPI0013A535D8|nr:AlpA family phage regulatory protein [Variovorax sp. PBL-H6]
MQTVSRSLRVAKAREFLGVSNTTIWRWVRENPDFPRPIKLSPKVTVFQLNELVAWRDAQKAAS